MLKTVIKQMNAGLRLLLGETPCFKPLRSHKYRHCGLASYQKRLIAKPFCISLRINSFDSSSDAPISPRKHIHVKAIAFQQLR